jgi:hypothetical protein
MTTKSNNSGQTAPELPNAEDKPSIQEQIDFINNNIKAAEEDITGWDFFDEASSEEEKQAFKSDLQNHAVMLRAVRENLIAVKLYNMASERSEPEVITDRRREEIGRLLSTNIDGQIVYVDAYVQTLRKSSLKDFKPWHEDDMLYHLNILKTLKMTKWFIRAITDELTSMPGNQPTNINEEITEFVTMLLRAKAVIKESGINAGPVISDIENLLSHYVETEVGHE